MLTRVVRGYVAGYDPRPYLHAVHHETNQVVFEGITQECAYQAILVDVRSAVERADEPTPETGAAEDLVQLKTLCS